MVSSKLDLLLTDFEPRPSLTTTVTEVTKPRFAVIDVHNHLGDAFGDLTESWLARPATDLLEIMDASGVQAMIDLDGQFGEKLTRELAHFQEPYPDRFAIFAGVDYDNFATDPNFGETEAKRLREAVAKGARGLKVWKTLGLHLRDSAGKLIPIDDERLDPMWQAAGELDVPVLIHIADPVAFFQPLDRFNERWEELHAHPDWHFYPTRPAGSANSHPDFPTFDELMDQFENMMRRHPGTNYIGAHVGCYAENLHWVGRVMDACPNFHADISARIAELGRQPYTTREFILAHPDQVLFGTDLTPDPAMYQIYYRFAETRDEYFNYGLDPVPSVGRWQIYGLSLPDDVLKKFYFENANRLVFKGALTPAW